MTYNKGRGKGIKFLRDHLNYDGRDCLIWPYATLPTGYGFLGFEGKIYRANRLMCELAHGPAPSVKHEAAHSCGNGDGGCIHPQHLSWKTPKQNQGDRKGHGTSGNPRGKFVLTEAQVAVIRSLKGQRTQQSIADEYGVKRETISQIMRGRIWAGTNGKQRPFQPHEIDFLKDAVIRNMRHEDMAKALNRTRSSISTGLYRLRQKALRLNQQSTNTGADNGSLSKG